MAIYEFYGKQPAVDPSAFVHPEATLIGDVRIDTGCYIGAGAVLKGDIGSVIVGTGSKPIMPEQMERIRESLEIYQALAQRHNRSLRKIG
ncbi:hypothetical protein DSCO28_65460 [Desulfosarcina ovata subsp. sediminis]|uniref:Uncharacterized protein n=1 Tax=Desulfosarcina ovata subsp. sediminis TaxID=885957 RepID=A0A5K8A0Y3_9BACT|nr:hypothetical protein [Desulfosarcina ovata]BBO85980.1 hypothetical protein DSCO28_65460 [Desulfosarcina ovata subsp. sediminis]